MACVREGPGPAAPRLGGSGRGAPRSLLRRILATIAPLIFTWLLLDSGVVDVIMSYNAICTSRIILEGLVFQEPYKRGEPSKRPCEHKTLESNKSLK